MGIEKTSRARQKSFQFYFTSQNKRQSPSQYTKCTCSPLLVENIPYTRTHSDAFLRIRLRWLPTLSIFAKIVSAKRDNLTLLIKYRAIYTHALTRFVFPSHGHILLWPASSTPIYNILHLGTWLHDLKQRSSSTMAEDRICFVLFAFLLLSQFPLVKLVSLYKSKYRL